MHGSEGGEGWRHPSSTRSVNGSGRPRAEAADSHYGAAEEREACARLAEELGAPEVAAAIRGRKNRVISH
jgi:hypothetical protein